MVNFNKVIEDLEKERDSKVLVYITGNKPPIFGTKIASDVLPFFNEALEAIPSKTKRISLVLSTMGGDIDTPWPLVNLIREYCEEFEVLIPDHALSAGTLISLGADRIVMLPYSSLSPIDPAKEIVNEKEVVKIEIEDIIGYIDFAKDKVGIKNQDALVEVIKELSKEVNPTILGSVNRTHSLIRSLAKNLLLLHKKKLSSKNIDLIISRLAQKLYSHRHLINRREARNVVGFKNIIEFADSSTKKCLDDLFILYSDYLELNKSLDLQALVSIGKYDLPRAVVHSLGVKNSFISNYNITLSATGSVDINNVNNKWEKI